MLFRSKKETQILSRKEMFLISWCGMRGVVSLAMAFSIPFYIRDGVEFPYRNLILFITFVVIIVTLVLQGLLISPLIKFLKIENLAHDKRMKLEEQLLGIKLAEASLSYIDTNFQNDLAKSEPFRIVHNRYQHIVNTSKRKVIDKKQGHTEDEDQFVPRYQQMLLELIEVRRKELVSLRLRGEFDEELLKEKEFELDLEEARLRVSQS